jgi:predicted Zn-dependent peptidase
MTVKYHYYRFKDLNIIHFQSKNKQLSKFAYKFKIGSSSELPDEWGLAHMLEHNIFKGNKIHGNSIDLNRKFKEIGYARNASTGTDNTCYYATGLSSLFSEGLNLLTDLVFHPSFPEDEFIKEKNPILNELEMYASDPISNFFEVGRELILGEREHNIVGTKKTIRNMNYNTMIRFYKKYYTLENVTLIIEDHRSRKEIEKLLNKMELIQSIRKSEEVFNGLQLPNLANRSFNERNKTFFATTDSMAIVYSHQSLEIKNKIDILIAPLAEKILSDILYEEIRDRMGLATYSIQASFSREGYPSISNVYALVSLDNLKKVKNEMAKILYNHARLNSLITDQLYLSNKLLRNVDLISIYNEDVWYAKVYQRHNVHFDSYEEILSLYDSITKEDILTFLKTLLSRKKSILILKRNERRFKKDELNR